MPDTSAAAHTVSLRVRLRDMTKLDDNRQAVGMLHSLCYKNEGVPREDTCDHSLSRRSPSGKNWCNNEAREREARAFFFLGFPREKKPLHIGSYAAWVQLINYLVSVYVRA